MKWQIIIRWTKIDWKCKSLSNSKIAFIVRRSSLLDSMPEFNFTSLLRSVFVQSSYAWVVLSMKFHSSHVDCVSLSSCKNDSGTQSQLLYIPIRNQAPWQVLSHSRQITRHSWRNKHSIASNIGPERTAICWRENCENENNNLLVECRNGKYAVRPAANNVRNEQQPTIRLVTLLPFRFSRRMSLHPYLCSLVCHSSGILSTRSAAHLYGRHRWHATSMHQV